MRAHNINASNTEFNRSDCTICIVHKATKTPHPASGNEIAKEVGENIHIDLGSLNKDFEQYHFYMLCKYEESEFLLIYLMRSKYQTFEMFERLIRDFEHGSGKQIRSIQSDNGSEFNNIRVELLLLKQNISHEFTALYNPEQNGRIEREMRSLSNSVRTMLYNLHKTETFIIEAIKTACYLKNRLPTTRTTVTPYERFTGRCEIY